MMIGAE